MQDLKVELSQATDWRTKALIHYWMLKFYAAEQEMPHSNVGSGGLGKSAAFGAHGGHMAPLQLASCQLAPSCLKTLEVSSRSLWLYCQ